MKRTLGLLTICSSLLACSDSGENAEAASSSETTSATETGTTGEPAEAPLALTPTLCEDPANMDILLDSPTWNAMIESGGFNLDQVERMVQAPTEGPFYMVNLIRYREWAVYPDGRETDLTGREANALYNPVEFLAAIGAQLVFNTEVDNQIDGDDPIWHDVAIVEYPCPVAFFAMIADPEFQARSIHKAAGVETTYVMVTDLLPGLPPEDPDQSEAQYPPSPEDPAFDLIHVMDFHDIAQYEPDANEPERTGEEAWQLYQEAGQPASVALGHYLTGRFEIQGVITGDDRSWDEIQIVRMSSLAGFQALLDDPDREAAKYHRLAALAHNYSMITFPALSQLPNGDGSDPGGTIPVTPDGTGTLCETDADCPGDGVNKCLTDGSGLGFCTREGCGSGECQSPFLCCHDCSPAVEGMLPFEGSACFPDDMAPNLTMAPISCSCD